MEPSKVLYSKCRLAILWTRVFFLLSWWLWLMDLDWSCLYVITVLTPTIIRVLRMDSLTKHKLNMNLSNFLGEKISLAKLQSVMNKQIISMECNAESCMFVHYQLYDSIIILLAKWISYFECSFNEIDSFANWHCILMCGLAPRCTCPSVFHFHIIFTVVIILWIHFKTFAHTVHKHSWSWLDDSFSDSIFFLAVSVTH